MSRSAGLVEDKLDGLVHETTHSVVGSLLIVPCHALLHETFKNVFSSTFCSVLAKCQPQGHVRPPKSPSRSPNDHDPDNVHGNLIFQSVHGYPSTGEVAK